MEAIICTGTPDVPTVPERQAMKLPDGGAPAGATDKRGKMRKAIMAGLVTSPNGLGNPSVTKPKLG